MDTQQQLKNMFKGAGSVKVMKDKNAVIYTRVSTKEQADNNNSLETQRKYCVEFAQKYGYKIVSYFGGTYESAKTDERKEFTKMLDFIKKSKESINYIIVYSVDRFSRSGVNAAYIAKELREIDVHILSCTQQVDTTTSGGQLQQNIQFIFSEYDNMIRREKCVSGMKELLKEGYRSGRAPLGYKHLLTNERQKIVIDEESGPIVRQAFALRGQGVSIDDVASQCKAMGRYIDPKRLSEMFMNVFYCGYIRNKIIGDELVKGKHEPLVSEELFLKINGADILYPQNFEARPTDNLFPLKRFITCAKCGVKYVGYTVKGRKATYYKCNTKGCKCNRNADIIHGDFKTFLSDYMIGEKYTGPLKLQLSMTFQDMNKGNEGVKAQIYKQLREVEGNINTIEERFALGKIEEEVFRKVKSKYLEEQNVINNELRKVDLQLSNVGNFVNYSVKLASKLNTMWGSGDFSLKQGLQTLLFPEGVLYDYENAEYRTCKSNSVFLSMAQQSRVLGQKESGKIDFNINFPASVV
ncbi:Site-specific DNA recombinase [Chitinophaga sp. CF118]|uniref:recombinase family protein n=1 Tax=Chitinophaga sp. CF118 TaxID=1884367 RepID=UPI0008E91E12|nr:recombinase family protein [Chitinophaga sp. CF118]SFE68043.1 Site-specific DNA recombinase [Chitinophaga sp. CF118]